jgi:hypothetical protein
MGIGPHRNWDTYDADCNFASEAIVNPNPKKPTQAKNSGGKKAEQVVEGNPNPKNFRILQSEEIGRFVVLLVNYPDCRNFEGDKILVFEDVPLATLRGLTSLDPHFCDSKRHSSPLARFEPTLNGWIYATKFCKQV